MAVAATLAVMRHGPALVLGCCIALVLAGRVLGPSDIDTQAQPKTISYTVDMVRHGRWLLPRAPIVIPATASTSGQPAAPPRVVAEGATKPPLYNWLSAPVVALGFWDEWAFRLPSVLAVLLSLALTMHMARWMLRPEGPGGDDAPRLTHEQADRAAWAAGLVFIASYPMSAMIYYLRPDAVLIACLTGAWILGTKALAPDNPRPRRHALGLWLCVGLALLAKGPAALLAVAYLPLAARLLHGRWALVHRTGWWWGLPLAAAMFLAWGIPAYLQNPDHFVTVIWGEELAEKVGRGGSFKYLRDVWKMPFYFVARFLPWSIACIAVLIAIPARRWMKHPLAPAILWLLVTILFFDIYPKRLWRYMIPCWPAGAVIAAYGLMILPQQQAWRWRGLNARTFALIALVMATLWGAWAFVGDHEARRGLGQNIVDFAVKVRHLAGEDAVAFEACGYTPLPALTGRLQLEAPTADELARAAWVVRPVTPGESATPLVVSGPIPDPMTGKEPIIVGLYRAGTSGRQEPGR